MNEGVQAARETHEEMLARRTAALGVSASDIEHLYVIYYDDLGLCGCGDPEGAWKLTHALLRMHVNQRLVKHPEEAQQLIGTPGAVQMVLGALDNAGLTEHGSSYWGGWLTDRGKWLLDVLNRLDGADIPELWEDLFLGYPHDGAGCPDDCLVPRKEG